MAKAPTKTGKKKVFKKKEKKTVLNGIVHVQATFNNTIISITRCPRKFGLLVECRLAGI